MAIVTGSTSGIGRAIAVRFAAEGARVLVTGRDAERGASVVEQCEGRAAFVAADLTEPDASDRLVNAALERFASLTVVVNNAVGHSTGGTVLTTSDDEWRSTLAIDLLGPVQLCRAAIPAMASAGHGSIVMVSSRAAARGTPGQAAYSSAKGGLEALARAIAVDHAPAGVRCNVIRPGYIVNDRRDADLTGHRLERLEGMHLLGLGTADDVAHAAVYLASSESRWVTGITIPVDGGSTIARAGTFG